MPGKTAVAPKFLGMAKLFLRNEEPRRPSKANYSSQWARMQDVAPTSQYFGGSSVTPGHEAAGVVIERGPGTQVKEGTPGVVFLMDYCRECRSCRIGFTNQCLAKRADMGFTHDGGYGPYEVVHESNFFPVDGDLDLAEATMLLDVMGTSGHAISRAKLVRPDIESAYIAGAGPIGLGLLVMCKLVFGPEFPVRISDARVGGGITWRLLVHRRSTP